MNSKNVISVVVLVVASSLLIYANFDNKSTNFSSESSLSTPPSNSGSEANSIPSSNSAINQFQQRLDEQRLHPSKPSESSSLKYPPGHDPFKAFIDTQKQQMDKARVSPFEK